MGMVATEAPVMISSHWLAFSAENCARPSVMVYFSLLSNAITGHKKEFQFPKKVKMPNGAERWGDQRQGNSGIHSKFAQSVNPGPHPKARWERR